MNQLTIPKETFTNLKKPTKLLLISFLTVVIADCITVFKFNSLDIKTKIIICLLIFSIILIIDIIVLYIQYYMFYYQTEYLNKIYNLIDINLDNIHKSITELRNESSEIRESINENNKDIEYLKSNIS